MDSGADCAERVCLMDWMTDTQRTEDWFTARLGHLTASRMNDALDYLKSGCSGAKRKALKLEVLTERLTGKPVDKFTNTAMQWGIDNEAAARTEYERQTGNRVAECGFAQHQRIPWIGASPDGLIGDDGLVEIKCPNSTTHLNTLLTNEIPEMYKNQMILQLFVTGRLWCDFVSFDPRFPAPDHIWYDRFTPTVSEFSHIEAECLKFLDEITLMEKKLRGELYENIID
jgi:putative phage-type endonuclease